MKKQPVLCELFMNRNMKPTTYAYMPARKRAEAIARDFWRKHLPSGTQLGEIKRDTYYDGVYRKYEAVVLAVLPRVKGKPAPKPQKIGVIYIWGGEE